MPSAAPREGQVTSYLTRPATALAALVTKLRAELPIPAEAPYIGVHVRHGDKGQEAPTFPSVE